MKATIIIVFLFCLFNNFALAKEIKISAYPDGSEVFVRSLKSSDFKKVGETPLSISAEEISRTIGGEEVFIVEVRKIDYKPYRIVFSEFGPGDINLEVRLEARADYEMNLSIEEVSSEILEAQRMARGGRYDDGLEKLKALAQKYPKVSLIHELIGSIYYLKKDFKSALDAYSVAVMYNPKNFDAEQMKSYLEKAIDVSKSGGN